MTGNPKIINVDAIYDVDTNDDENVIGATVWWTNYTGLGDKAYVEIHMICGINDKTFVTKCTPDSKEIYSDPCEILVPENAKTDEVIFRTYVGGPGNLVLIQEIKAPVKQGNLNMLKRE